VLRRLRAAEVTRAYTSDGGRAKPDARLQAPTSLRHDLDAAWIARVLNPDPSLTRGSAQRRASCQAPAGMNVSGAESRATSGRMAAVIVTYNIADVDGDCLC
jgi:hypothetical protein